MSNNRQQSIVASTPTALTISAKVIRCGCGNPDSHNGKQGLATPCPKPKSVEDLGVISFYHTSWVKRWAWSIGSWLKRWAERGT